MDGTNGATRPPIVAFVCSAGGVDALLTVLPALPRDLAAAVLVLQHQAPDRASYLVDILRRRSLLPVFTAEDGVHLATGTIHVVPPGTHALVTADDRIVLVPSDGLPPYRPSADLLFTSLALSAGKRAIGVILSGSGHDGATGAVALHRLGGTVVATDEATSSHFEMPSAAIERDDAVDFVMPLGDVATLVRKLAGEPVAIA